MMDIINHMTIARTPPGLGKTKYHTQVASMMAARLASSHPRSKHARK